MKIYIFQPTDKWETRGSVAIVANNEAEAIEIYENHYPNHKFDMESEDIEPGLALIATGYDSTGIYAQDWSIES